MADSTYTPKTYRKQGGDEFVVASGGKIIVETGGIIAANGGTQAPAIADVTPAADGTAAGTALNLVLAALRGAGIIAAS